jgi:predicted membrane protein
MAKGKNDDGGPLVFILVVLAVLGLVMLTAAIYISPIVLVLTLLYFEFRAPRTPNNFTDVLPNLSSFIRRVCSGYAPDWGVLRTQSV